MWPEMLEPIDGAVTPRSVRMRLSLRAARRGAVVCVDDIARMDVNELHGVMFTYLRELHNLLRACGGARAPARGARGAPRPPARPRTAPALHAPPRLQHACLAWPPRPFAQRRGGRHWLSLPGSGLRKPPAGRATRCCVRRRRTRRARPTR